MDGTHSERGDGEYLRWTVIISLALCQARKKGMLVTGREGLGAQHGIRLMWLERVCCVLKLYFQKEPEKWDSAFL